jgi:formamidopyrimidine-DNA glycosylase
MPELPEVETMVRGIRPSVEGRRIREVLLCDCECKPILLEPNIQQINRRVQGTTVNRVWRRAKRVVLSLSSDDAFVVEPRMTGLMLLDKPPDEGHLRIQWSFEKFKTKKTKSRHKDALFDDVWFWDRRGLGTVRLLDPDEQEAVLGLGNLGKDALEVTADDWWELSRKTSRAIKVAMLDQKRVAGIGNLYASEILHVAKVSPELNANRLSKTQCKRIAETTVSILETSILYEGSTLGDGTYRNAMNQSGGYQNAHKVYAREGETCPTCNRSKIVRIVQAQRSTFFCRNCQRKPRRKKDA